jgi:hypothetical protein
MMPTFNSGQQPLNVDSWHNRYINRVFNFCSIVTMPVEMALRPFSGTRYYPPLVIFMSAVMMLIVPVFFTFLFGGDDGLIGLSAFTKFFFAGLMTNGIRKLRLMIHPQREKNSNWANEHLFFFNWLPKPTFWRIRIVYEPLFVVAVSVMLQNFFILTQGAGNFLITSAVFLAMKNYTHWYMEWEQIRTSKDTAAWGPALADFVSTQPDTEAKPNVARVLSDEENHGKA